MKQLALKTYVALENRAVEFSEKVKDSINGRDNKKDEGSFLTEPLGIVAVTVALVLIALGAFKLIMGNAAASGAGTGVLGTLQTKIMDIFN